MPTTTKTIAATALIKARATGIRVTIERAGLAAAIDVTNRLKNDIDVPIDQKQERRRAERVVGALRLVLSDRDNYLSNLLLAQPPTTVWFVRVYEGDRRLFNGYIDGKSARWGLKNKWLTADALAIEKLFWQRAEQTKIWTQADAANPVYTTLRYIIENELVHVRRLLGNNPFEEMLAGIDLGEFADRPIRYSRRVTYSSGSSVQYKNDYIYDYNTSRPGWTDIKPGMKVTAYHRADDQSLIPLTATVVGRSSFLSRVLIDRWTGYFVPLMPNDGLGYVVGLAPGVGLEGMWVQLDPNTTVADFLRAAAEYYEAEFTIPADTRHFTMRPRMAVLNDRANTEGLDIDPVLREDREPEAGYLDADKYDFVRIEIGDVEVPAPVFRSITTGSYPNFINQRGRLRYQMTTGFAHFESPPSDLCDVYISDADWAAKPAVNLTLPVAPYPGVRYRRLYRVDPSDPDQRSRFLEQFNDNTTTLYTDTRAGVYLPGVVAPPYPTWYPPDNVPSQGVYLRYDEDAGVWDDPFIDISEGVGTPSGNILTIAPRLSFRELNETTQTATNPARHVMKLFGNEPITAGQLESRKRLFMTTRPIWIRVRGLNYLVGDSVRSRKQRFPNDRTTDDRMLVREARNVLNRRYTDLALVTI